MIRARADRTTCERRISVPRLERCLVAFVLTTAPACGARTQLEVVPRELHDAASEGHDAAASEGHDAVVAPETSTVCGPSNCVGCCDEAGACQPGKTEASCGEMGRACAACDPRFDLCRPDPQNPDGRVCFSPCATKACNYHCCARDGTCTTGEADDACGSTGELCLDCASTGAVCDTTVWPHECAPR